MTAYFRCCSLEKIEERNFNVVIVSEVLEHLQEPELLLREAAIEHLSNGGILIVTVPNGYGEFELDNYIFTKLRVERMIARFRKHHASISGSGNHDGHVQWFRLRRLRAMFLRNGLELIHKGSGPLACGPLAAYAFNHLPRAALKWNARVTDHLPMSFASGWYFVLSRAPGNSHLKSPARLEEPSRFYERGCQEKHFPTDRPPERKTSRGSQLLLRRCDLLIPQLWSFSTVHHSVVCPQKLKSMTAA